MSDVGDNGGLDVVARMRVEGVPDALAEFDRFKAAIESLAGPVSTPGSSLPSGASSYAPPPPDPSTFNGPAIASGPGGPPIEPSVMYSAPAQHGAYVPPGALAGGNNNATFTIQSATIQIADGAVSSTGATSGGAAAGSAPSGGAPSSTASAAAAQQQAATAAQSLNSPTGAAPAPGEAPVAPFNNNTPPVPTASWLPSGAQRFLSNIPFGNQISEGLAGGVSAETAAALVPPLAIAFAALEAGKKGIDYYATYSRPGYALETGFQATEAAGHALPPSQIRDRLKEIADQEGWTDLQDHIYSDLHVPSSIRELLLRGSRRDIEVAKASAERQGSGIRAAALLGMSELPLHAEETDINFMAQRSVAPYGRAAMMTALMHHWDKEQRSRFGDDALGAFGNRAASMGQSPIYRNLRDFVFNGGDINSAEGAAMGRDIFAESGDLAGLETLIPHLSAKQLNEGRARARRVLDIQQEMMISSSQLGIAETGVQRLQMMGGGYQDIGKALQLETPILQGQIEKLQEKLSITVTEPERENLKQQIAHVQLQKDALAVRAAHEEYGQRGSMISARQSTAGTLFEAGILSGAQGDALNPLFARRGEAMSDEERLLREQSSRTDLYNPSQRAEMLARANQVRFQRTTGLAREQSQTIYSQNMSAIGLKQAYAQQFETRSSLFGGPAEYVQSIRMQESVVGEQIKEIIELLKRGNLSAEEQSRYQSQLVNLQTSSVQLEQQRVRGEVQQYYDVARGKEGIAGTQRALAFSRGVGGPVGEALSYQGVEAARKTRDEAVRMVKTLREQHVSEDNPTLLQWRQQAEQAELNVVQQETGLAHTQQPIGLQRELSAAGYQAQVLSMVPGSYGSIRSALQRQVAGLEKAAENKKAEYQQVIEQYGGEQNVPENVKYGFQQELQQIGMQQAGAVQKLSYGWESRLLSQVLGTPGSYGMYLNRFSFRDATNAGVVNPHFGATKDSLPFFLRQADQTGSIAGSTGTPAGFAATALSGVAPRHDFDARIASGANAAVHMAGDKVIRLEVQLKWPDGTDAGRISKTVTGKDANMGGNEALADALARGLFYGNN